MASRSAPSQKTAGSPRFTAIAIALAALLVLAAGGMVGFAWRAGPGGRTASFLGGVIGGPFHLVDQNAKPFTEADLKGRWDLVFFGFTHCDDTCPMTLNNLALARDRLGAARDKVQIVFVSVDPERDTPAVLKSYVARFGAPIVALTGTADEVKAIARGYRVFYARHPLAGGGYDMDHSAVVYVMDPQGRFAANLAPDASPDEVAARLKALFASS